MGMKFRKSVKLGGGTRLNLSKSGIGVSTGVKGFRVSKNTSGRSRVTASLPGTGLSYTKEYGSSGSSGNRQAAPVHHSSSSSGSSNTPSGGGSGKKDKPPFFQRPGVIFLCLLLFAPLGIFLMWRYIPQWKTGMKVALSVLFGLVFLLALVPKADSNSPEDDHSAAIKAADPPSITEAIGQSADEPDAAQQKPEQTADPTTETGDTSNNGAAAQETTEDPQSTVTPEDPVQEQPDQEEPVQQEPQQPTERTVYITPTGSKYHREHCRTIKGDKTAISLSDAIARGYEACGVCGG